MLIIEDLFNYYLALRKKTIAFSIVLEPQGLVEIFLIYLKGRHQEIKQYAKCFICLI